MSKNKKYTKESLWGLQEWHTWIHSPVTWQEWRRRRRMKNEEWRDGEPKVNSNRRTASWATTDSWVLSLFYLHEWNFCYFLFRSYIIFLQPFIIIIIIWKKKRKKKRRGCRREVRDMGGRDAIGWKRYWVQLRVVQNVPFYTLFALSLFLS